ncbi:MAG: sulfurtransferase, partial [Pseudomonadota bacterium]
MTRERLLCTPAELYERLQTGHCTVLDSRFNLMQPTQGADQYRDAHIPGAAYVHLDNELSSPPEPNTGRHPLPSP